MNKYFVKDIYENKLVPVIDVWESYTGWYWFITEQSGIGNSDLWKGYAYGLVIGLEPEWGEVYIPELEDLSKQGMVWKVPKMNWFSISHIITKGGDK